jgi:hypothetical protein
MRWPYNKTGENMKNIRNLDNFRTPEYQLEYSDKSNIQYLKIFIIDNYSIIEEVSFDNLEAIETYKVLISEDTEEIKQVFLDIFINYIEGV